MCLCIFIFVFLFVLLFVKLVVVVDIEKGKEINGICVVCYGEFGQGGKKGEYLCIVGQWVKYVENQLRNFWVWMWFNILMFFYIQECELLDEDIRDIVVYLVVIELLIWMLIFVGNEDVLICLLMVEKVMIILCVEGNIENGGEIYQKLCVLCYVKIGLGCGMFLMFVG